MQDSCASVFGLNGFLRDIDETPISEGLSIRRDELLSLVGGKEVEIVLPDQFVARKAEQIFAGTVETDESQLLRLLHEDHVRDVLYHRAQDQAGTPEFLGLLCHLELERAPRQP